MDPWDHIRTAAADRRSGSAAITARAARGVALLTTRADVMRAARVVLRARPEIGSLWNLFSAALAARDIKTAVDSFAARLETDSLAAADCARWVVGDRATIVLVHSASGTVASALTGVAHNLDTVLCTESLPGGEGRAFAKRLARAGIATEVVPDAGIARACARAHIAFVGAETLSDAGAINKLGTRLVALAAHDANIGCYVIASTQKLVPARIATRTIGKASDVTPLDMFDAILTEKGPRRAAVIARAAAGIEIPPRLETAARLPAD